MAHILTAVTGEYLNGDHEQCLWKLVGRPSMNESFRLFRLFLPLTSSLFGNPLFEYITHLPQDPTLTSFR